MPHARKYGLPRCAPRFPWCYANRVATMFGLDNPFQSKIEMPLHGHILNPGHIFWGTWYIWIFGGRDWYELVLWPKKQNNISFPLEIDQAASAWYPVETMFFFGPLLATCCLDLLGILVLGDHSLKIDRNISGLLFDSIRWEGYCLGSHLGGIGN
jgi:hypothetical protein